MPSGLARSATEPLQVETCSTWAAATAYRRQSGFLAMVFGSPASIYSPRVFNWGVFGHVQPDDPPRPPDRGRLRSRAARRPTSSPGSDATSLGGARGLGQGDLVDSVRAPDVGGRLGARSGSRRLCRTQPVGPRHLGWCRAGPGAGVKGSTSGEAHGIPFLGQPGHTWILIGAPTPCEQDLAWPGVRHYGITPLVVVPQGATTTDRPNAVLALVGLPAVKRKESGARRQAARCGSP